jgi:hypothetical protein
MRWKKRRKNRTFAENVNKEKKSQLTAPREELTDGAILNRVAESLLDYLDGTLWALSFTSAAN